MQPGDDLATMAAMRQTFLRAGTFFAVVTGLMEVAIVRNWQAAEADLSQIGGAVGAVAFVGLVGAALFVGSRFGAKVIYKRLQP